LVVEKMNKKIILLIILTSLIGTLFTPSSRAPILNDSNLEENDNEVEIYREFFDRNIERLMKLAHKPSVSAGIIIDDKLVWSKGYGLSNIEKNKSSQPDSIYLSASISKTVTATALMQLYEKGLFGLDEDVNNYLPFRLRNPNHPNVPITFRMLLSHRSSLAGDNTFWICLSYVPGDPDIPDYPYPWLKDYLTPDGSAYSPIVWSENIPGKKYAYANIGFSIIGYLVELISGEIFNEYCKKHIFEPLQMYNTSFRLKDINLSNLAIPYEYNRGNYIPHPHYNMLVIHPGGSMRTSIEDLSHFLIAHMNGGIWKDVRILNSSTVELMHKDHYANNSKEIYGFGWTVKENKFGKKEIGHSGGWPGVDTRMRYRPDDNIGVIMFTNSMSPTFDVTFIESKAFKYMFMSFLLKAYMLKYQYSILRNLKIK
jgi:CubicO group peptidase (beta-lactamase class C family)